MQNHEDNPVRISKIITQKSRTSWGMQWAEAYRVTWTCPATYATLWMTVGDKKSALALKRKLQGKPIAA